MRFVFERGDGARRLTRDIQPQDPAILFSTLAGFRGQGPFTRSLFFLTETPNTYLYFSRQLPIGLDLHTGPICDLQLREISENTL